MEYLNGSWVLFPAFIFRIRSESTECFPHDRRSKQNHVHGVVITILEINSTISLSFFYGSGQLEVQLEMASPTRRGQVV